MRLWVMSDWHLETRLAWQPTRPESFDVLVVAGDVDGDLLRAIDCVALIADCAPVVFVAGNHEIAGAANDPAVAAAAGALAEKYGVAWLEGTSTEIGGVRFAGATLWEEGHPVFMPSVRSLAALKADVIVTHFRPDPATLLRALPEAGLWIYGRHHGYEDTTVEGRRLVRNALGYANEPLDGQPAIADLVIEI